MSKSLVTQLAVFLACGGFVAWQLTGHFKLRSQSGTTRLQNPNVTLPQVASADSQDTEAANAEAKRTQTPANDMIMVANLKEILAQPDPMSRMRGMLAYVQNLSPDQLGKALDELRAGAPDWDPEAKFVAHMLLTRWGQEDPDAAFASLNKMDYRKSGGDASSVLSSLAAVDPKRAVEWLNDPDNAMKHRPGMGHILSGTIAKEWARQDPEAAFEWATGLPKEQRVGAYTGVLGTMAASDPVRASTLALELEPGRERGMVVGQVAKAWAKQSPGEALAWAETFEGRERHHVVGQAIEAWTRDAPVEAASYVEQLEVDESGGQTARVAANWAQQSPSEAAEWLSTRPEGKGKEGGMGRVMWQWTTTDPAEASTWLAEQPAGQSRDIGAAALSKAAFDNDPEGAVSWASTIADDKMRSQMINRGLSEWVERDTNAAQAWATANGVEMPAPKKEQRDR